MIKSAIVAGCLWCASSAIWAAAPSYFVAQKLPLPGDGGWDYLSVDADRHLLYLSRATHVAVVDTQTGRAVGEIADTPGVHGIALAPDLGRGFISVGKANQVRVFDLQTLKVLASIGVGSKPDAIVYNAQSHKVFAFNGHSDDVSVIDATSNAVVATIALGGAPEFARADGIGHIYVNIENKNELVALDVATLRVTARWPLPGCDGPTGLALDAVHHRSFSVCANAAMTILNIRTGKSVTTLPIGRRVDSAEFDADAQNAFSANGDGTLTVVHEVDPDHFIVVQTLGTALGARTLALDPKAHKLYLPTASFGEVKETSSDEHPKPPILPGTFVVLVVASSTSN